MRDLVKAWLVPGTPSFLLIVIGVSLPLIFVRRTRALGIAAAAVVILSYLLLSLPIVADAVAAPLAQQSRPADAVAIDGVDAVLLLIGDNQRGRAMETVRLFRLLRPRWVIVSGPSVWAEVLQFSGIAANQIIVESQSGTTYEQATGLRPVIEMYRIRRIVLVASQVHMPRAFAVFQTLGYDVIPAPSPVADGMKLLGWWQWIPQTSALELSRDAIYEYCALPYYRWRGWIVQGGPARERRRSRFP